MGGGPTPTRRWWITIVSQLGLIGHLERIATPVHWSTRLWDHLFRPGSIGHLYSPKTRGTLSIISRLRVITRCASGRTTWAITEDMRSFGPPWGRRSFGCN